MGSKWMRSTNVVWEELDGEMLLIDISTGLRWTLNASAASIWRQCDGQHTFLEIADDCAAGADRALRGIRREVAKLCEALAISGLLIPSDAAPSVALGSCSVQMSGSGFAPIVKPLGVGANSRRRPTPRGNSGPG